MQVLENKALAFLFWITLMSVDNFFLRKICIFDKYILPLQSISRLFLRLCIMKKM
jgi:hypothetical protein